MAAITGAAVTAPTDAWWRVWCYRGVSLFIFCVRAPEMATPGGTYSRVTLLLPNLCRHLCEGLPAAGRLTSLLKARGAPLLRCRTARRTLPPAFLSSDETTCARGVSNAHLSYGDGYMGLMKNRHSCFPFHQKTRWKTPYRGFIVSYRL
jgi:hypothetical protein